MPFPKRYCLNADGEPAGRMVNNHGHWEYQYDDPAMNAPLPPELAAADDPNPPVRNEPFHAVELRRRRDEWTAERQRQA